MDGLTVAAAAGLQARMEALDMLANNVANASTAGFKKDGEFYNLFLDAEAAAANGVEIDALPVIEKHWTDFTQGTLAMTGRASDLALSGSGFFAVDGPSGPLYTRNGSFQVDASGKVTTGEGYTVRLAGGGQLQVNPALPFDVAIDGWIQQGGVPLGRLEVVDFKAGGLAKQNGAMFRPAAGVTPSTANAEVHQGKLENANVGTAESAVRIVSVMRQFEMLQKAIGIGADMNRKAVEELARVGS